MMRPRGHRVLTAGGRALTAGTIVFSPTSATQLAETFATLPTIAPQIKTAFGLDAKVVVETPIEELAGTDPARLKNSRGQTLRDWLRQIT